MEKKRKKVVLKIKEKIDVINQLENGVSVANVSKQYGISPNTVRDIKKNKANLMEFITKVDGNYSLNRKSIKKCKYEEVDVALLDWFIQNRNAGAVITGPMCLRQAKYYHEAFSLKGEFTASSGWLSRFKNRYGISEVVEESSEANGSLNFSDDKISPGTSHPRKTLAFDNRKKSNINPLDTFNDKIAFEAKLEKIKCESVSKVCNETLFEESNENVSEQSNGDVYEPSIDNVPEVYVSNGEALNSIDKVLVYMKQCGFDTKELTNATSIKEKIQAIGKVLGNNG